MVGKSRLAPSVVATLKENSVLDVSRNEVEIMSQISQEEFDSRREIAQHGAESSSSKGEPTSVRAATILPKGTLPQGSLKAASLAKEGRKLARYDPDAPGAFVLYRPSLAAGEVAVVLEPRLASKMRPHQLEGVKFMYECVNGLRDLPNGGMGCILADEMVRSQSVRSGFPFYS